MGLCSCKPFQRSTAPSRQSGRLQRIGWSVSNGADTNGGSRIVMQ
jgi:hypothetical protein